MIRAGMMALVLGGQGAVPAEPLKPVSKWNVEYATNLCVISRTYGDAAAPITIGFKPTPFADPVQAIVIGKRTLLGRQSAVDVAIEAPARGVAEKVKGTRVHFPDGQRAVISYYLPRAALNALAGAPTVAIRVSGTTPLDVALSMGRPVLDALQKCETDLLVRWGYDPARIAAITTPAQARSIAEWISHTDYPSGALNAGKQGRVLIGWTISTEGLVSNCRVLESSGVPELDVASCAAITKRGRYETPALDAAGRPVEYYSTRFVNWQLP